MTTKYLDDFYSPYGIAGFVVAFNQFSEWNEEKWEENKSWVPIIGIISGSGEIYPTPNESFAYFRFPNRGYLTSIQSVGIGDPAIANGNITYYPGGTNMTFVDSNGKSYSPIQFLYSFNSNFVFNSPVGQCITRIGARREWGLENDNFPIRPVYESTARLPKIVTTAVNPINRAQFIGYVTDPSSMYPNSIVGLYDIDYKVCNFTDAKQLKTHAFDPGFFVAGFNIIPQLDGSRVFNITLLSKNGAMKQISSGTIKFTPESPDIRCTTLFDAKYTLGKTIDTITFVRAVYDHDSRVDFVVSSVTTRALPGYTGLVDNVIRNNPGSVVPDAYKANFKATFSNPTLSRIPTSLTTNTRLRRRFDQAIVSLVFQTSNSNSFIGYYQPDTRDANGLHDVQFIPSTNFREPQDNRPNTPIDRQKLAHFRINFLNDTTFRFTDEAIFRLPPTTLFAHNSTYDVFNSYSTDFKFQSSGDSTTIVSTITGQPLVAIPAPEYATFTGTYYLSCGTNIAGAIPVYLNIRKENEYTTLLQTKRMKLLQCCNPAGINANNPAQVQICTDHALNGYQDVIASTPSQGCINLFTEEKTIDMSNEAIQTWCFNNKTNFGTECQNRYADFCQHNNTDAKVMPLTCACFMDPSTVYIPYFQNLSASLGISIPTNVQPVCSYPPCAVLKNNNGIGVTPYDHVDCPDIVTCIQNIAFNIGGDGVVINGNLTLEQKQQCGIDSNTDPEPDPDPDPNDPNSNPIVITLAVAIIVLVLVLLAIFIYRKI